MRRRFEECASCKCIIEVKRKRHKVEVATYQGKILFRCKDRERCKRQARTLIPVWWSAASQRAYAARAPNEIEMRNDRVMLLARSVEAFEKDPANDGLAVTVRA